MYKKNWTDLKLLSISQNSLWYQVLLYIDSLSTVPCRDCFPDNKEITHSLSFTKDCIFRFTNHRNISPFWNLNSLTTPRKASSRGNHAREPNKVKQNELYVFRIIKYLKVSDTLPPLSTLVGNIKLNVLIRRPKFYLLFCRHSRRSSGSEFSCTWV